MKIITDEEYTDAEADTLALIRALTEEDWDALAVMEDYSRLMPVLTVTLNLLFAELAARGADPGEWVAAQQAALRARLAAGSAPPARPGDPGE